MTDKISRRAFYEATGVHPEQDDLERCNCKQAGKIGHFMCGWDEKRKLPNFWPKVGKQSKPDTPPAR